MSVLDGSPECTLVVDDAGVIKFANRAAIRFYDGELAGLAAVKFLPEWFNLQASCRDFATTALVLEGRERPVSLSLAAVEAKDFVAVVAVFRDLSQHLDRTEHVLVRESSLRALVLERDVNLASMRAELGEAARILANHLPSASQKDLEVSWLFEPCQTLGGDMLWVHKHANQVVLGALDVSGHGVAASLLAIGLSRSLSPERGRGSCVLGRKGVLRQPMDIVARLNQDSHTLFESGLFVTLLFGILDLGTGEFRFTCAGHPLPVRLWREVAQEIPGSIDPPLGVERFTSYRQSKVNLRPGELLIIYTDGVTECRSPSGELFGDARLMELVARNSGQVDKLTREVGASLKTFRGELPASDDVSLLAIRIPPSILTENSELVPPHRRTQR